MSGAVRVYIPLTAMSVGELASLGTLPSPPEHAFAVTARLVSGLPEADDEEREYAAFVAAAQRAAVMAGPEDARRTRAVVAAADIPAQEVTDFSSGGTRPAAAVSLARPVTLRSVVSLHVGESIAADADLLWYDITEIDLVRTLLSSPS